MNLLSWVMSLVVVLCGLEAEASDLTTDNFIAHKTITRDSFYNGKTAILVEESHGQYNRDGDKLVVLKDILFQDGEIEVWLAGDHRKDSFKQARGFVGIAFRISKDLSKFEAIYLRPANGRSDDQLRRNHSTQYVSYPEYTWDRFRRENPGKYESYADMKSGEWIKYRLVVKGTRASLYLDDNSQPSLIINDLKHGPGEGGVGFWIGPGTTAYYSGLEVDKQDAPPMVKKGGE